MTPTQLRAYAEVARQGSVGGAAETLGVTDAAVSMHIRSLRKEFGDELFHRTGSGLAFTPGGLRLASRAVEMLGLQDRTRHEVTAAATSLSLIHISEPTRLRRISYAVFCLKKKKSFLNSGKTI